MLNPPTCLCIQNNQNEELWCWLSTERQTLSLRLPSCHPHSLWAPTRLPQDSAKDVHLVREVAPRASTRRSKLEPHRSSCTPPALCGALAEGQVLGGWSPAR